MRSLSGMKDILRLLETRNATLVIAASVVAAYISARFMAQGNPLVTLPWGAIALVAGFSSGSRKEAWALGGCLGFIASYAYLWFDDSSKITLSQGMYLTFLIILPSLFGLLCGLLASWAGWAVRRSVLK